MGKVRARRHMRARSARWPQDGQHARSLAGKVRDGNNGQGTRSRAPIGTARGPIALAGTAPAQRRRWVGARSTAHMGKVRARSRPSTRRASNSAIGQSAINGEGARAMAHMGRAARSLVRMVKARDRWRSWARSAPDGAVAQAPRDAASLGKPRDRCHQERRAVDGANGQSVRSMALMSKVCARQRTWAHRVLDSAIGQVMRLHGANGQGARLTVPLDT
jgi:hypothetical protein